MSQSNSNIDEATTMDANGSKAAVAVVAVDTDHWTDGTGTDGDDYFDPPVGPDYCGDLNPLYQHGVDPH